MDDQTICLFSRRTVFSGKLKKPWEVLLRKKKLWHGLLMRREWRWSLGNWRLPAQPRLLSHSVILPISFSYLMLLLTFLLTFPFKLIRFLQIPLLTMLCAMKWKSAVWWSLPCNEKILWQTPQRLNKATHSITQCHLTEGDVCQKAGWVPWFLFFLLLSGQQVEEKILWLELQIWSWTWSDNKALNSSY